MIGICVVFFSYQDENTSALMMVLTSTLWLGVRMTLLCSFMVAAVGFGAIIVTQSPCTLGQEYGQYHFNSRLLTHRFVTWFNTFSNLFRMSLSIFCKFWIGKAVFEIVRLKLDAPLDFIGVYRYSFLS